MTLYHSTPATRLRSILAAGILPALATGARREVWLHSPSHRPWAACHVAARHSATRTVAVRVAVPRGWLTRRGVGLWTCDRPIPPSMIQAVDVAGLRSPAAAA